ncbi:NAD(P)/FAD-dependent oxidoreductase [Natronocalculus amylovorans]|uniref:FAD-dependent oxidoreductase n=1 Tax=Natronocalculus amylovorans TaxID=2917812 RepID=A0AAE3FX58_9EURY|nr:FAD-dependent oxidoreductase [Natronocalculus amylovorans]MCL9816969.1 FAD-dependent oxidoreductase [Natronocalculus amylovorans]
MHVVVFGAGYAGVTLTRSLERSLPRDVSLTLIDESPNHLVQHEVHRAIRRPSIAEAIQLPLDSLFDRATVTTAHIESIDPDSKQARLDTGETVEYDYGAICLGADTAYYGLDGLKEHSIPLKRLEDADQIRSQVLDLLAAEEDGTVVVGGAGLSGIQVAGEIAALVDAEDAADRIEVVLLEMMETVAPSFPEAFQQAVHDQLVDRDIRIRTGITVERATETAIQTDSGAIDYDVFVWTGGIAGQQSLAGDRPLVRNDLRVNRATFVLGDAARAVDADGKPVPASASAAIREAKVVGENLTALVEHERSEEGGFEPRMKPYRFEVPGWIVSVGDGAVAQVGPKVLTGKPAKAMKATVGAGYLSSVRAIKQAVDLVEEELHA